MTAQLCGTGVVAVRKDLPVKRASCPRSGSLFSAEAVGAAYDGRDARRTGRRDACPTSEHTLPAQKVRVPMLVFISVVECYGLVVEVVDVIAARALMMALPSAKWLEIAAGCNA